MSRARGLRLLLYDRTCTGPIGLPGLSTVWRTGAGLYGALDRLDGAFGATATLPEGLLCIVDDSGAGTAVWLCTPVNSKWWYVGLKEAL